jgi:hypothetical protein
MELRARKISQKRFGAFRSEEEVTLASEDDCLRIVSPQELLPLRIQSDVRAAVIEEVQLNLSSVGTAECDPVIKVPIVWAYQRCNRLLRNLFIVPSTSASLERNT